MSIIRSTLYREGTFYKGNTHCHSIHSDGSLKPEALKKAYQHQGYQFLLFSDHNVNTDFHSLNDEHFLSLQGFEGNLVVPMTTPPHKEFHLLFMKTPNRDLQGKTFEPYAHLQHVPQTMYDGTRESVQKYVKAQQARGYMAIFNHPHWSFNDEEDIACLEGLIGMEIFNYGTHICENCGNGELMYDLRLRKGHKLWCFAADDNHNHVPFDSPANDSFGGFIVVKAKALQEESLLEAIADGSFYASMGPEIFDFYVQDGYAYLTCSAAQRVYITDDWRNYRLGYRDSGRICAFTCEVRPDAQYVRAEVIDELGRKAYSNPIWLRG